MSRLSLTGGAGSGSDPIAAKADANFAECYAADVTLQANIDALSASALNAGIPFRVTNKITAVAAKTAVHLLPDPAVPAGKAVHISHILVNVSGSTAWSGGSGTELYIKDTATSAKTGVTIAATALTGNAVIDSFAADDVVATTFILLNTGFTAAKGIDIKADENFGAGSDIYVTIEGYIY